MNEKDNEQDYKAGAKKLIAELIVKEVEAATKELSSDTKKLVSKLANEMSELRVKAFGRKLAKELSK